MRNSCLWTTLVVLAFIMSHETVQGAKFKSHEPGSRIIDARFCGEQILDQYFLQCARRRKRRSALMDESVAKDFFSQDTGTDIVEECCYEGCRYEEIQEYC